MRAFTSEEAASVDDVVGAIGEPRSIGERAVEATRIERRTGMGTTGSRKVRAASSSWRCSHSPPCWRWGRPLIVSSASGSRRRAGRERRHLLERRRLERDRDRPGARKLERARRNGAWRDVRRCRLGRRRAEAVRDPGHRATGCFRRRRCCAGGTGRPRRQLPAQAGTVQPAYDTFMAAIPIGLAKDGGKAVGAPRQPGCSRCGSAIPTTTRTSTSSSRPGRACSSRSRRRRRSTRSWRSCDRSPTRHLRTTDQGRRSS